MPSEQNAVLQFGDVVLVRFPFTNQTASKQRPAVVISNASYNIDRPDVILMALTSQLHSMLSLGDVPVEHWKLSGLLKPSAIKPVIATVEQALIIRQLGVLQTSDISALRSGLAKIIG